MTDADKVIQLYHLVKECKHIFTDKELSPVYYLISNKLEELLKPESKG
jgi:hypothetical protein